VVSQNSEVKITVKPFAGLPAWGPALDKGEIDLGFGTMPEFGWAYEGTNGFEKVRHQRLMVRGNFILVTGPAVRADSGIYSSADLKQKRVAGEYPAVPTTSASMNAYLAVNNLSWEDVRKVPVPTIEGGIEAIRDNRVDAAAMMTPTTPLIVETHNAVGLRGLNFIDHVKADVIELEKLPKDLVEKATSLVPGSRLAIQEPLGFITEPTIGLEYPTALVASSYLNDETAYEMIKSLFDNYEELHPIHKWLSTWTPELMFDPNPPIPYHPGAVKLFKEKGLWNDEIEIVQQNLLEAVK